MPSSKLAFLCPKSLLRAMGAWCLWALVLTAVMSLLLLRLQLGQRALNYMSSAVSFFAAFAAGAELSRGGGQGLVYSALIAAGILTLGLLTLGFLAAGAELPSGGILSVVSFTFSGCLAGAVLLGGARPSRSRPRPGK